MKLLGLQFIFDGSYGNLLAINVPNKTCDQAAHLHNMPTTLFLPCEALIVQVIYIQRSKKNFISLLEYIA